MYVFGGYEEIIERFGQDVYRLDLDTYRWKLLVNCASQIRAVFIVFFSLVMYWRAPSPQRFSHSYCCRSFDDYIWRTE